MDKFSVFSARLVDKTENFTSGHRACQGCAEALAVRHVMKALGRDTIVAMATGCMEIISSPLPLTSWKVPWIHNAFENPSAVISGVESGMKAMMRKGKLPYKKINYVAMGGDGATADIGMGQLSGALERGHDFLYVCYDNEAYMNTGVQRSGTTPKGAITANTPYKGKLQQKKDVSAIIAAHGIEYVGTTSAAYPLDLYDKFRKALTFGGVKYIHIHIPCPPGWGFAPQYAVKVGKLAVETGLFELSEIEHGRLRHTGASRKLMEKRKLLPVREYFRSQSRFNAITDEEIEAIQQNVTKRWECYFESLDDIEGEE